MTDSTLPFAESLAEGAKAPVEPREAAAPEPTPRRPRYRPSEAWALRWLGSPSNAGA